MNNLQMLTAIIRVVGLYLLVTIVSDAIPFVQVALVQPEALPEKWGWLYLLPIILKLALVFAMVLVPMKLANWGGSTTSVETEQTPQIDIALIGVRLLGAYFILQATPGLLAIPFAWPIVTTGQSSFLRFFFQSLAPSMIFLVAGVWMFIGSERLVGFIKSARTANFERKGSS